MECVLSTIPAKERAAAEIARVLRPGGRVAVSDVVVDADRLPPPLEGPLAQLACIGSALDAGGYERLLARAGLAIIARESLDDDAARLAERVEDRLRGARVLGFDSVDDPLDLVRHARAAIAEGSLGYGLFVGAQDES
jgi:SAM-dependent methyltransferase